VNASEGFSSLVQRYFTQHLCQHKQVSPRTLAAYRDTFRLLFTFLQTQTGKVPSSLGLANLDAPVILAFLDHLESERGNESRSRNARLSAIRSFFKFVSVREPERLDMVNRVLAIPNKRTDRPMITFLSRSEVDAIVAAPDRRTWLGSRDHAFLLTMSNSGARCSELMQLKCGQLSFGSPTLIHLHGKGRKDRTVPLWPQTAQVLRKWFQILSADENAVAFPSVRKAALTADGVDYLLQRAVAKAVQTCPELVNKRVTPHVLRHTTAMHLLQSGVDIAVIALWLGHESIETTHGYVEADLELKERALDKLTPASGKVSRFKAKDSLLQFLSGL
jgi:integrase/recombinase XerD